MNQLQVIFGVDYTASQHQHYLSGDRSLHQGDRFFIPTEANHYSGRSLINGQSHRAINPGSKKFTNIFITHQYKCELLLLPRKPITVYTSWLITTVNVWP